MNTHTYKEQENKRHSASNGEAQMLGGQRSTFQFVDNRPEAIAQRKLQEAANNSPQVKQFRAMQEGVNKSPQVQQTAHWKAIMNGGTAAPIQQKKGDGNTEDNTNQMTPPPFQLKKTANKNKDVKVTLAADVESEFLSKEYRKEGAVGHAWIKVQAPNQPEESYGFWPANLGAGGGFDPAKPWKTVAGEVRSPDDTHTAKQEMSEMTDAAGLSNGLKYVAEKQNAPYNLLTYNCTSFARAFFKKSTGVGAPSAGFLGIGENPNWLADGIEKRNKAKNKKNN
jgi:hypothetical protein